MIPRFRARDKEDNVMREVAGIHWGIGAIEFFDEELDSGTYDLDKYDVVEYLDESDKNGTDVCVGDIVKYHPSDYIERNTEYDQYLQVVRVGSRFVQTNDNSTPDIWYDWDELVVVGNVYENPDLLEATE